MIVHFSPQGTILWRSYLLCHILNESFVHSNNKHSRNDASPPPTSKLNQLAFRIGLFGLETPRLPAISKALEVKLINQEQDLANLLKRLQIGAYELNLLRDRATKLKENGSKCLLAHQPTPRNNTYTTNYHSLPIMLASFIFDTLHCVTSSYQPGSSYERHNNVGDDDSDDQQLGFDASISVIGMKANISEAQHALRTFWGVS